MPTYHRRICMIQDMLLLVKQGKQEEATELLKNLRQVRMGGFLRWEGGCGEGEKCGERPILLRGKPKRGPRSAFAGLALVASFWGNGRGAAGWSRCQRGEIPPGRCRALSAARKPCRVHFSSLPSSLAPIALGFPELTRGGSHSTFQKFGVSSSSVKAPRQFGAGSF